MEIAVSPVIPSVGPGSRAVIPSGGPKGRSRGIAEACPEERQRRRVPAEGWFRRGAMIALGIIWAVGPLAAQTTPTAPAVAQTGMVSTAHPLATEAGLSVLAAGGNAFDAAVAIAAALNVVEPMMSGIGGYGTILVYDAKTRRTRFLNSSGRIPAAVNSDAFRAPTPNYLENRRGAKAVSTPVNLHAWEAMSREYGTRPWRTLFAPAIRLADSGFVVSERIAGFISGAYSSFPPHAKAIYGSGSGTAPLAKGQRLVQPDLARSLRL